MATPATLWMSLGPALAAVLVAVVGDVVGGGVRVRRLVAGLLAAGGLSGIVMGLSATPAVLHDALQAGGAFSSVSGIVLLAGAFVLLAQPPDRRRKSGTALLALAATGAVIAASGADLVMILIGLEVAAVSGYALVASSGSPASAEASMKYFVQGALATGLFVLGMAVVVGAFTTTGTLASLAGALGSTASSARAASMGAILLLGAVAFKAGAAPFHSWAPDAYETAPSGASAFLAGGVKLATITVLASLMTYMAPAGVSTQRPLGVLGLDLIVATGALALVSIVIGSTVALVTPSYKRMLGYAGVAQVGYALVALAAFNPSGAVLMGATYAVATTAAFLAAGAFSRLRPDWDGTIEGLAGLGRSHPLIGVAVSVAMLSLAGVPPLVGFWGKLQAFGAAVTAFATMRVQGNVSLSIWYGALLVAAVAGSVVSLAYYGSVIRALFFSASVDHDLAEGEDDAKPAVTVVSALGLLILVLGILPVFIGIAASVAGFQIK